jgi:hypothetical protein
MAESAYPPCVALRKDGRPCRAVGRVFDPARQGLVCDAHQPGGPGSKRLKRGRLLVARDNLAQREDITPEARAQLNAVINAALEKLSRDDH